MDFKIDGDVLALCIVDMKGFRDDFKRNLNLKDSIQANFKVVEKGMFDDTNLFKMVLYGLDWGTILSVIKEVEEDEMVIRFYKLRYVGKIEFTPDMVSQDGRHYLFKQEVKDGNDVIMINSFIKSPDFAIQSYLNYTTFNYGKVRWQPLGENGN